MPESADAELGSVLDRIRSQATSGRIRITLHAHEEMVEEGISLADVLEAIQDSTLLEYYSEHRRGPCGLLNGSTSTGRPVHVVCTTAQEVLVLITVYEPKRPKWVTPTQRSER